MSDIEKLLLLLNDADQINISQSGKIEIVTIKKLKPNDAPCSAHGCRCDRENRWGAEVSNVEELFFLVKEEVKNLLFARQQEVLQREKARHSALRQFSESY